ncbi:aminotransferase class V-fold PLP-dependent enzyme [Gordonia amarae]|uniref:aminotransferase class V-fold PLP-dependent enzyme n=1 Tax=Gordonia amarae TaxID=36821 RepID=UPI001AF448A6|nr:aminotransferase class V-fold PLP-dependent enzyme [Gordonia amarae]QHN32272.1 aminotransferase class V-fold PLP-dependent enzyme [Gordonia amarae]
MTAVLSSPAVLSGPAVSDSVAGPFIPALAEVVGCDERVRVLDGSSVRYANFDYAASAPALRAVADGLLDALPQYASVHRGAGALSQITTHRYEQARETVRRFVRARTDDHVVFTRNTTDSINLLAHCLAERGGDIVVLDIEHHANLLPWQRLSGTRVVTACGTVEDTLAALDAELASKPAALLAITAASNVTGEVLPISRLASIAHRHGARILVDGAQLVAHQPISVVSHGIDYLVFSGHKLYAPFGAGVLVGRGDWLDEASPYLAGGGASAEVGADGAAHWHSGPARHEAGSPNVLGAVSIADACTALAGIGFEHIGHHEHALRERLDAGLAALDGVRPLRIFADTDNRVGIAGFAVDGFSARTVACYLADHHGIGVRDGRFCAHPLLARLGYPDGAVRASFGLGTDADDVDRLLNALSELVSRRDTGRVEESLG